MFYLPTHMGFGRFLLLLLTLIDVTDSAHLRAIAPKSGSWDNVQRDAEKYWCENKTDGRVGYLSWGYVYDTWHNLLPPVINALTDHQLPAGPDAEELRANGNVYMFGVAHEESILTMKRLFPDKKKFGFDSFKGLPPETDKLSKAGNWNPGDYKPHVSMEKLIKDGGNLTKLISGFFNESLTQEIVKKDGMGPAFYVDIDCDLYSSTYPVLDFLFANRIARVGTLIGYDDWWTVACRLYHGKDKQKAKEIGTNYISPLSIGEGLAHKQIAEKYGVSFRCVAGSCLPVSNFKSCHLNNHWSPIFVVEAIHGSGEKGAAGFEFTSNEEKHWMGNMGVCATT